MGSSSDSDREQTEKKGRKAKRARITGIAPTPCRMHGSAPASARVKSSGAKAGSDKADKAARFKKKVENAVQHYVTEHAESWTMSEMREDLSEVHGWDNDSRLAAAIKNTLLDLGYQSGGANTIKGTFK